MGKRKRLRSGDSDYNNILRKVKKLESKLRKRRRLSSSVSEESDQSYERYYYDTVEQGYEGKIINVLYHNQNKEIHFILPAKYF